MQVSIVSPPNSVARRSVLSGALCGLTMSFLSLAGPASAQDGCVWSTVSDPVRQVISCGPALTVEREAGTEVTIFESTSGRPPNAIEIRNGAILINVVPGGPPTQIRTPHAIAAVRGTTYLVDAGANSTSVFVLKGSVAVSKQGASTGVTLGSGEGVDVEATVPLEVKTWGAARVSALLARFGR